MPVHFAAALRTLRSTGRGFGGNVTDVDEDDDDADGTNEEIDDDDDDASPPRAVAPRGESNDGTPMMARLLRVYTCAVAAEIFAGFCSSSARRDWFMSRSA